jgi:very-short-patch-repair endonuclease
MFGLSCVGEDWRRAEDSFDEARPYFPLSPTGGEGQGEGAVVTERTIKERAGKAKHRGYARRMRKDWTKAEDVFWFNVRARRLNGYKFRRQHLIGPYIVDFVCLRAKLIVELDGGQHALQQEYDRERDAFLKKQGFRVLRFWNTELLTNRDGVLETVLRELQSVGAPSP